MTGKDQMASALSNRSSTVPPIQGLFYDGYIAHCAGLRQWEFDYGDAGVQWAAQQAALGRHPYLSGLWTWTGMNRGPMSGVRLVKDADKPYAILGNGDRRALSDSPAQGIWDRTPDTTASIYRQSLIERPEDIPVKCGDTVSADGVGRQPGYGVLRRLADSVGNDHFLFFNHSSLWATCTSYLGGLEGALIATVENPALVEAVLDHLTEQHLAYIEAGARAGAHGVWNCFMNEGANIMSPDSWRRFVKPRAARIVEKSHEMGLKHVAWFLDDCRPLVQDLVEIGMDGLSTEQPRGNYSCEPGDLRKLAGDSDLCIFGWFWEGDLLKFDREALRRTLRKQHSEAGEGTFVVCTPGLTQEYSPEVMDFIAEETEGLA